MSLRKVICLECDDLILRRSAPTITETKIITNEGSHIQMPTLTDFSEEITFHGPIHVTDITESVDSSTGCLTLSGGLGCEGTCHILGDVQISGDLEVLGTTTTIDTIETTIKDKLITLNIGGLASSAGNSGIEIVEEASVSAYIKTSADRNSMEIKAPNKVKKVILSPNDIDDITLSQSWTDQTQTISGTKSFEDDIKTDNISEITANHGIVIDDNTLIKHFNFQMPIGQTTCDICEVNTGGCSMLIMIRKGITGISTFLLNATFPTEPLPYDINVRSMNRAHYVHPASEFCYDLAIDTLSTTSDFKIGIILVEGAVITEQTMEVKIIVLSMSSGTTINLLPNNPNASLISKTYNIFDHVLRIDDQYSTDEPSFILSRNTTNSSNDEKIWTQIMKADNSVKYIHNNGTIDIDTLSLLSDGNVDLYHTLLADTLGEHTLNAGVTIDGLLIKDAQLSTDVINELTPTSGITIDGVLLKDSQVSTDVINELTTSSGITIDGVLLKDNQVSTDVINELIPDSGVTIDGILLKDGNVLADNVRIYNHTFTIDSTADRTYEFNSISSPNGCETFEISMLEVATAITGSYTYVIPDNYSSTGGGWHRMVPSSYLGAQYLEIDIYSLTETTKFRVRRILPSIDITVYITCEVRPCASLTTYTSLSIIGTDASILPVHSINDGPSSTIYDVSAAEYKILGTQFLRYDDTDGNIFIGSGGPSLITAGDTNISIGKNSCQDLTSGAYNIGIGSYALQKQTTGKKNICVGRYTGYQLKRTSGEDQHDILIGYKSGENLITGTSNTMIGDNTGSAYTSAESNNILIGDQVSGTIGESNRIRLGNSSNTHCYINSSTLMDLNGKMMVDRIEGHTGIPVILASNAGTGGLIINDNKISNNLSGVSVCTENGLIGINLTGNTFSTIDTTNPLIYKGIVTYPDTTSAETFLTENGTFFTWFNSTSGILSISRQNYSGVKSSAVLC